MLLIQYIDYDKNRKKKSNNRVLIVFLFFILVFFILYSDYLRPSITINKYCSLPI